jgi:hypothetical protein
MHCIHLCCAAVCAAAAAAQVAMEAPEALLVHDVGVIAEFLAAKLKDW